MVRVVAFSLPLWLADLDCPFPFLGVLEEDLLGVVDLPEDLVVLLGDFVFFGVVLLAGDLVLVPDLLLAGDLALLPVTSCDDLGRLLAEVEGGAWTALVPSSSSESPTKYPCCFPERGKPRRLATKAS